MKLEEIENIINGITKFLYMNDINLYKLYPNKNNINEFITFDVIEYFRLKCSKPHKIYNFLKLFENIDMSFIDYLIEFVEKIILFDYDNDLDEINYIINLPSPEEIKNNIRLLENKISSKYYINLLNEFNNFRYNKKIEKKDIYNHKLIFDEIADIIYFEHNHYYFIKLIFNLLVNNNIRDILLNNLLKDIKYSNSSILNHDFIYEILNHNINNKINILINKLKHCNYYKNEILTQKINYFQLEQFINKINKIIKRKKIK